VFSVSADVIRLPQLWAISRDLSLLRGVCFVAGTLGLVLASANVSLAARRDHHRAERDRQPWPSSEYAAARGLRPLDLFQPVVGLFQDLVGVLAERRTRSSQKTSTSTAGE